MATAKKAAAKPKVTKAATPEPANLVFHQLILRNIDRTPKDVADWRLAHRMAEAVTQPTRRRIFDLYDDVVLDAHLTGIWKKRVSSVVNKKIMFTKDGEEQEEFDALIKSKAFRQLRKKLMKLHSHGIVGIEFIPGQQMSWKEIPARHIRPEKKLITIEVDGEKGFEYQGSSTLWVLENEDEPLGFLLKAAPYALFKKGNYSDWAEFVEIFGQPVIITKYDGYDEKTRTLLTTALEEAGSSLRLMLPKQAEFEMMDGKTSNGDGRLQETFKNALNNEMSILVLGNTETTTSDNGGSNAKAQIHAGQQLEITKDDLQEELLLLNDTFFLEALKMYGYNTEGGCFQYEDEVDNAALKAELDIDEKLQKLGVPLDHDYFYNKYHRPKPDNYDTIMAEKKAMKNKISGNELDDEPGDDNPDDDTADPANKAANKKQKAAVEKAIAGLSFWEKVKAVFSTAP